MEIGGIKSYQSIFDKVVDDMADFGDQSIMFQWYEYAQLLQQTVSMLKANKATITKYIKKIIHQTTVVSLSVSPQNTFDQHIYLP